MTGDYTLADGRQGNMYHGPYPTNTAVAAVITQTENAPTATISSTPGIGASSVGMLASGISGTSTVSSEPVTAHSQGSK